MAFPKEFVWGAASAAYQIEGASKEDGRGASVWDTFSHTPGKTCGGQNGDVACDAFHRSAGDVDLLTQFGIRHYRFSISWPRIFPDGRTLNPRGFDYYDRLVDRLLEKGVTPWITLFHWDTPQALEDEGGWLNRSIVNRIGEYAGAVAAHFRGRVKRYFTLNEPQCFIGLGYGIGLHAPGKTLDDSSLFNCWHNALLAHGAMTRAVRAADPKALVGAASCGLVCIPESDSAADLEAAREATFSIGRFADITLFSHNAFLDPVLQGRYPFHPFFTSEDILYNDLVDIRQPLDFIGLNFYNARIVRAGEAGPELVPFSPGYPRTAFRWPVTPEMMYYGTRFLYERYGLPLYVTENGASCNDKVYLDGCVHDLDRVDFLRRYLLELRRACEDGVDVRGYFHWSLTDNFEWNSGYEERFGLVYMDYPTLRRIPKDSAGWYADIIRTNGASL